MSADGISSGLLRESACTDGLEPGNACTSEAGPNDGLALEPPPSSKLELCALLLLLDDMLYSRASESEVSSAMELRISAVKDAAVFKTASLYRKPLLRGGCKIGNFGFEDDDDAAAECCGA